MSPAITTKALCQLVEVGHLKDVRGARIDRDCIVGEEAGFVLAKKSFVLPSPEFCRYLFFDGGTDC